MQDLIAFLIRRFAWMLLTLWIVFTISFFLMRFVPGGPFSSEKNVPEAIKRNIEARFGLNDPLAVQYFDSLMRTLKGDFGPSYRLEDFTVNEVIAQGFPISASLAILALCFALLLGVSAGVVSALKPGSLGDLTMMILATLGIAIPNFVLASLLIIVFVFWFDLFPTAGWGSAWHLILPALCLGAPIAAYIARLTRAGLLETIGQDYIRTAKAKGLPMRQVIGKHALRGALLPVVSYLGPAAARVLTGSIVLEQIFVIPGMGSHFVEAALQRDYLLSMGLVLVYTALLFLMNTLVDLSYSIIDPRVKLE
ncbi:MAG: ABC transporter permease subunit [Pirellulaceae bacterium]